MSLCDPQQYRGWGVYVPCVDVFYTLHMFTFSRQKQLRGQAALSGHQHCRAANCLALEKQNCTNVALL